MALCSDLLMIAADAKIGYPPGAVGAHRRPRCRPTGWARSVRKRLLFTGDSLSGTEALDWGLAIEAPAGADLDERTEICWSGSRATR